MNQIAIDGYSSCGKSTLAKALSQELKYTFIDTGAMYRCVSLYFIEQKVDLQNPQQVDGALENITIIFDNNNVLLNQANVNDEIRELRVANCVSEVAAISSVRRKLVNEQRNIAKLQNVVMDGRDIGTVVFPKAIVKFFLTADPLIRAKRRYDELLSKGNHNIDFNLIVENLKHRDHIDSTREDSPLRQAEDAILIDNSSISEIEQFELALQYISNKITY